LKFIATCEFTITLTYILTEYTNPLELTENPILIKFDLKHLIYDWGKAVQKRNKFLALKTGVRVFSSVVF
jgi:hypothetical protein